MKKQNLIIVGLIAIILGLIYFNRLSSNTIAAKDSALVTAKDTLHSFKSKFGSQAGYISVITADKNNLVNLLSIEKDKNKDLINLVNTNKTVQTATDVQTKTVYKYIDAEPDTVLKGLKFTKKIQDDEWITESISVDSNKLSRNLEYRDALLIHSDKKDNKGWFTGSTLTTYAEPKNPKTTVTGITSISTVVDKRKVRVGAFVGPAINIDIKGNTKLGVSVGVGLTF